MPKVLVMNAGSSSHKLSLFSDKIENAGSALWKAHIEWGKKNPSYTLKNGSQESNPIYLQTTSVKQGIQEVIEKLWIGDFAVIKEVHEIEWIGHRIVHGGSLFHQPVLINASVKKDISNLSSLAPLHNPINLEGIELLEKIFPSIPHFAVFDTAFHRTMREEIKTYPIPYEWKEKGIERYGFHGISHSYCAKQIKKWIKPQETPFKLINCHLGNGASLCAIRDGFSIDTTMGFTPMEGLMMGTRSGSIDPGILIYCLRNKNLSLEELDHLLNFESGLKGIGGTSDMREIHAFKNKQSQLALDMYIYRLKTGIGAMTASLGGIDALCFTGGIGENDSYLRKKTCEELAYLGIQLDLQKNQGGNQDKEISLHDSPVKVFVIHTQEEWMIAKSCLEYLT